MKIKVKIDQFVILLYHINGKEIGEIGKFFLGETVWKKVKNMDGMQELTLMKDHWKETYKINLEEVSNCKALLDRIKWEFDFSQFDGFNVILMLPLDSVLYIVFTNVTGDRKETPISINSASCFVANKMCNNGIHTIDDCFEKDESVFTVKLD